MTADPVRTLTKEEKRANLKAALAVKEIRRWAIAAVLLNMLLLVLLVRQTIEYLAD